MDRRQIIRDALIHHGYTPVGADALITMHDEWRSDLAKHQIMERVKDYARRLWTPEVARNVSRLASTIDPLEPNGATGLRRKTTGEPLPAALQAELDTTKE